MREPRLRISLLRRPWALVSSVLLNVFEHTSSARRSVLWAAVATTGRISTSVTSCPRSASCHAASEPARPPPTTVIIGQKLTLASGCCEVRCGIRSGDYPATAAGSGSGATSHSLPHLRHFRKSPRALVDFISAPTKLHSGHCSRVGLFQATKSHFG